MRLCFAKILCARKIVRFPVATTVPSRLSLTPERQNSLPDDRPRGVPVYFRDATLVRIRQPDRTGGAALPVAHEKRRNQPFPS